MVFHRLFIYMVFVYQKSKTLGVRVVMTPCIVYAAGTMVFVRAWLFFFALASASMRTVPSS